MAEFDGRRPRRYPPLISPVLSEHSLHFAGTACGARFPSTICDLDRGAARGSAMAEATCAVFSNEVGEPLETFKKAWPVAVLKAYGVDPDKVSSFFQVSAVQHFADRADAAEKTLGTN